MIEYKKIEKTINTLYRDAQNDYFKMMKGAAKSIFRPIQPEDFKDVYLAISEEQGLGLTELIISKNIKNVVEFGTSFGISTLFLAQGIAQTGGHIITTELIASKAKKAQKNFEAAGVQNLIELRVGNALETLKGHDQPVDLLLLDGWKDLYHSIFKMLESQFHQGTIIYVDNADMHETQLFLREVQSEDIYKIEYRFGGKVALITYE